jgi:rhamnosyltransferase
MKRMAACVTLYHPDSEVVDNVRACLTQVERLYAVDNTEGAADTPNGAAREIAGLAGVVSLPAGGNLGTAGAMNLAARRAMADGYGLLLTLDQDSRVNPGMVARLLAVRGELAGSGLPRVGIVSARQVTRDDPSPVVKRPWQEEETIMTSGNLLELAAWEEAGPFDEGLFIDCVDHEFCLRLRMKGWAVVRVNDAFLTHELGNITAHRVFGKVKYTSNHSALRRYYIVRNRLWIMRKYAREFPDYCRSSRKEIFKEARNVLLLEADKGAKLGMMVRGAWDFWRGRMGRFGA